MDSVLSVDVVPIVVGTTVAGRYEILREIGRGGMGIVYLAKDTILSREVALKVIPRELALDPKAIGDLKRETAIALDLTHEHIVRLYNLETWEGQAFVTMEYVPGQTLSHLLSRKGGKLPLDEALPLIREMAAAIDYAHDRKRPVIHRDIKPLNILLTQEGRVKIADFGLARVMRDSASRLSGHSTAGTLAYMSPEQVRGKGIGPWSDIYALAAVAYEMLSGEPPFHTGDLQWQIMQEQPDPIADMDEHVNEALLAGLAKEKDKRPPRAMDLVRLLEGKTIDWEAHREEAAPAVKPVASKPLVRAAKAPEPAAIPKEKKSFPWAMIALIALVIAGVAGAGWYVMSGGQGGAHPGVMGAGDDSSRKGPAPALRITSEPDGATVFVDGGNAGASPLDIAKLAAGTHDVVLKKDRYKEYTDKVFIQEGTPRELDVRLVPEPFGDLKVTSEPSEATVFVDGVSKGTTPLTLTRLPAGTRSVKVSKKGFDDWTQEMKVEPLGDHDLMARLKSIYGVLEVKTDPSGASVVFDGKKQSGTTPLVLDRVERGSHALRFTLADYETKDVKTGVKGEEVSKVAVDLVPKFGFLSVTSEPGKAKVSLAGKSLGITPLSRLKVPKGSNRLEIVKGDQGWSGTVTVGPGEEVRISRKLETEKIEVALKSKGPQAGDAWRDPVTGMEFVWVPGGSFMMGSPSGEQGRDDDEGPVHRVELDGFWMGKYEVTNAEYRMFRSSHSSGNYKGKDLDGKKQPVANVSWEDAQAFVTWLNDRTGGRYMYALPAEAQWEYAARGGSTTSRYWGNDSDDACAYANVADRTVKRSFSSWTGIHDCDDGYAVSSPVGSFRPNGFGLYDMLGNVREWCQDRYDKNAYSFHARKNPIYARGGFLRVVRGGSWIALPRCVRSAFRGWYGPGDTYNLLGFRLLRTQ
jgi:formylglycine-generating enzyme required for sulfatase activity